MSRKECLGDDIIWIVFVADAMIWIAVDDSYAVACSLLEDFLTQGGSTSSERGENSVTFTVTISDILISEQFQLRYITSIPSTQNCAALNFAQLKLQHNHNCVIATRVMQSLHFLYLHIIFCYCYKIMKICLLGCYYNLETETMR
jgi:hypothetical protein